MVTSNTMIPSCNDHAFQYFQNSTSCCMLFVVFMTFFIFNIILFLELISFVAIPINAYLFGGNVMDKMTAVIWKMNFSV